MQEVAKNNEKIFDFSGLSEGHFLSTKPRGLTIFGSFHFPVGQIPSI